MREEAVIRRDVERCLVRLENRGMTVKGLYPLVATKIRVRLIRISQRYLENRRKY